MTISLMAQEAAQSPSIIKSQINSKHQTIAALAGQIREFDPNFVYIVGRGSSKHAGTFGKYLIEIEIGLPVVMCAPSVLSVYQQSVKLNKALVIVISQSGASPDILALAKAAKASGALTIAMVNAADSPLSELVDIEIPLGAGEEKAIAATKSYLATLCALLQLIAHWKQDRQLIEALNALPQLLQKVLGSKPILVPEYFSNMQHCVLLGRGFSYSLACEMALKIQEILRIHAEPFSSAEFLHGPVALVAQKIPLFSVSIADESLHMHSEIIADIKARGANILEMNYHEEQCHARCLPLLAMLRFYIDIEQVARAMGLDPDSPPGLSKVTKTL